MPQPTVRPSLARYACITSVAARLFYGKAMLSATVGRHQRAGERAGRAGQRVELVGVIGTRQRQTDSVVKECHVGVTRVCMLVSIA